MRIQVALRLYGQHSTKVSYLQLWNKSRGEFHAISHENWDYPKRGSSKFSMAISCLHTPVRERHICFQTIVFYGINFSNGYVINILRMSCICVIFCGQTTHEHMFSLHDSHLWARNSFILLENMTIKSPSAFGL
jgi:hypothetical protein